MPSHKFQFYTEITILSLRSSFSAGLNLSYGGETNHRAFFAQFPCWATKITRSSYKLNGGLRISYCEQLISILKAGCHTFLYSVPVLGCVSRSPRYVAYVLAVTWTFENVHALWNETLHWLYYSVSEFVFYTPPQWNSRIVTLVSFILVTKNYWHTVRLCVTTRTRTFDGID